MKFTIKCSKPSILFKNLLIISKILHKKDLQSFKSNMRWSHTWFQVQTIRYKSIDLQEETWHKPSKFLYKALLLHQINNLVFLKYSNLNLSFGLNFNKHRRSIQKLEHYKQLHYDFKH